MTMPRCKAVWKEKRSLVPGGVGTMVKKNEKQRQAKTKTKRRPAQEQGGGTRVHQIWTGEEKKMELPLGVFTTISAKSKGDDTPHSEPSIQSPRRE